MSSTTSFRCWTIQDHDGTKHELKLNNGNTVPQLGDEDVLVEMRAASLNYRDLAILKKSIESTPNVIPGSDGAGVVLKVGSSVSTFNKGDRVVTHLARGVEEDELPNFRHIMSGLGQKIDGTLTEFGVYHQSTLVKMPNNLGFEQAATLTCSALTAWNALFGLKGRELQVGEWILVQGTGGVSVAALQVLSCLSPC